MKLALLPFEERLGHCFELCFAYIFEDERFNDGSWFLVHGVIGRNQIWHGWLMRDGIVFDPVLGGFMPWLGYVHDAVVSLAICYSRDEAKDLHINPAHGPCPCLSCQQKETKAATHP